MSVFVSTLVELVVIIILAVVFVLSCQMEVVQLEVIVSVYLYS